MTNTHFLCLVGFIAVLLYLLVKPFKADAARDPHPMDDVSLRRRP